MALNKASATASVTRARDPSGRLLRERERPDVTLVASRPHVLTRDGLGGGIEGRAQPDDTAVARDPDLHLQVSLLRSLDGAGERRIVGHRHRALEVPRADL